MGSEYSSRINEDRTEIKELRTVHRDRNKKKMNEIKCTAVNAVQSIFFKQTIVNYVALFGRFYLIGCLALLKGNKETSVPEASVRCWFLLLPKKIPYCLPS